MENKHKKIIYDALMEDAAFNDVTKNSTSSVRGLIKAELVAKQPGIICGLDIVEDIFYNISKKSKIIHYVKDGEKIKPSQILAVITGPANAILSAERTALNFIQHLSGIATLTNMFVEKTKNTKAKIFDTRKTTPGLRELEKYAVRCGKGQNHRMNLKEMAMFKDNHLRLIKNLKSAISKLRQNKPGIIIEIECQNYDDIKKAMDAEPDIILLDNMSVKSLKGSIKFIKTLSEKLKVKNPQIEVSGGINLENVRDYAKAGVHRISVGAITHSAPALDISIEIIDMED